MNPSDTIRDNRVSTDHLPSIRPVPAITLFFRVLKEPKEALVSANASLRRVLVWIFRLAPNADEPLVEVPTPRWIWMLLTEEAKSGMFTQKSPCDSASFTAIPFMVTLIRVASLPRIESPVYPMPAPASDVLTTEGACCKRMGRSCPRLTLSRLSRLIMVRVVGSSFLLRVA